MTGVVWHEVECGGYEADLPLWEELATRAAGPILDLGCGTGRVSLHLARRGHEVTGLDLDAELVAAFNERGSGLSARAAVGDARDFALGEEFALALAPMQLVQLLSGPEGRSRCLRCVERHLRPGGLAAFAIVESVPEAVEGGPLLPDAREMDGWVYSSLPLDASVDERVIVVRRLRQTVSPEGELSDELNEVELYRLSATGLEEAAAEAGLSAAGRYAIATTDDHVGSTTVLLEKEA